MDSLKVSLFTLEWKYQWKGQYTLKKKTWHGLLKVKLVINKDKQ